MKIKNLATLSFIILLQSCTVTKKNNETSTVQIFPLNNYNQNINNYFDSNAPDYNMPLITKSVHTEKTTAFKEHFFGSLSPWSEDFVTNILNNKKPEDIHSIESSLLQNSKQTVVH